MICGAAVAGQCAQKKPAASAVKTTAKTTAKAKATAKKATTEAPVATAAATVPMTDDLYVEIKAHEAAFLAAGLKDKQDLAAGTMEQKMELARLAQQRRDQFNEVRKKLLAERKVSEQDYKAFESKITDETMNHAKTAIKGIDFKNMKINKIDDKDGFNARMQNLVDRTAKRAKELEEQKIYK
jgi:hypothetical protein